MLDPVVFEPRVTCKLPHEPAHVQVGRGGHVLVGGTRSVTVFSPVGEVTAERHFDERIDPRSELWLESDGTVTLLRDMPGLEPSCSIGPARGDYRWAMRPHGMTQAICALRRSGGTDELCHTVINYPGDYYGSSFIAMPEDDAVLVDHNESGPVWHVCVSGDELVATPWIQKPGWWAFWPRPTVLPGGSSYALMEEKELRVGSVVDGKRSGTFRCGDIEHDIDWDDAEEVERYMDVDFGDRVAAIANDRVVITTESGNLLAVALDPFRALCEVTVRGADVIEDVVSAPGSPTVAVVADGLLAITSTSDWAALLGHG